MLPVSRTPVENVWAQTLVLRLTWLAGRRGAEKMIMVCMLGRSRRVEDDIEQHPTGDDHDSGLDGQELCRARCKLWLDVLVHGHAQSEWQR
nr:PREDICTED: uncharacterized protein LOC103562852 isoform X2 [Equus przewalskii]